MRVGGILVFNDNPPLLCRCIKYLHKYVYKGPDKAMVALAPAEGNAVGVVVGPVQARDEIKEFIDGRYISSSEACWRLFEFDMHGNDPSVYRLPVHLPGEQVMTFQANADVRTLVRAGPPDTRLMAWFRLNENPDSGSQQYVYPDIPANFTWDSNSKSWQKRRGLGPAALQSPTIGRMYFVHPSAGELSEIILMVDWLLFTYPIFVDLSLLL